MNNDKCCEKCYGRQGTRAGGGIYCLDKDCPCHTPPQASLKANTLTRACACQQFQQNGTCEHLQTPFPSSQEEPWEEDFKKWYVQNYPANWKAHVVVKRIKALLEADRKERAGVVVERVAKMFDKDALKESGDTMGTVALYSYSRGWNNAIKKIVKIIKDVMK